MSDTITKGSEASSELTPKHMFDLRQWTRFAKEDAEASHRRGELTLTGYMAKWREIDSLLPEPVRKEGE